MSGGFQKFYESEGILRELTTPYTPEQNSIVERKNSTVIEMVRNMMKETQVLDFL